MMQRILIALRGEYPDLLIHGARVYARGRDVTERLEILLASIEAEPERAAFDEQPGAQP